MKKRKHGLDYEAALALIEAVEALLMKENEHGSIDHVREEEQLETAWQAVHKARRNLGKEPLMVLYLDGKNVLVKQQELEVIYEPDDGLKGLLNDINVTIYDARKALGGRKK